MTTNDMLTRFAGARGPVYAADGEGAAAGGAPAGAATSTGDQQIQSGGIGELPGGDGDGSEVDGDLDLGLDPAAAGEGDPAEEWEDLEHDDLKLRVPKGLSQKAKDALMLRADHTKKTQEIADRARQIEAREKAANTRSEYDPKISEGLFHLKQFDNALQKEQAFFQSPEYKQLQTDDFIAAQARWNDFQMNLQNRAQLAGALQSLAHERDSKLALVSEAEKQEANKRREQLPREIAKLVPGWNSDVEGKVKAYAIASGYTPEAIAETTDPLHFKTLHEAMIGRMYLDAKARKGAGARVVTAVGTTRTVAQRGGKATPDPDKQSPDDFRADFIRKQLAKSGTARVNR